MEQAVETEPEVSLVDEVAPNELATAPESSTTETTSMGSPDAIEQSNVLATSGGRSGLMTYYRHVEAHLAKYRKYPRSARQRRQEGQVSISFTIHLDGKLTDVAVVEGSSHPTLDAAALETVKRASPVPKIPRSVSRESLSAVLQIDWRITD